jgi:hypothetical protein
MMMIPRTKIEEVRFRYNHSRWGAMQCSFKDFDTLEKVAEQETSYQLENLHLLQLTLTQKSHRQIIDRLCV